jgi:hypothetical protein
MPRRSPVWIWAGRIVAALIVAGLIGYLVAVGLDTADKLGSAISTVVALVALLVPYLLPASQPTTPLGAPTDGKDAPAKGPASQTRVDLREAKGVQINQPGATGTQTNTFDES